MDLLVRAIDKVYEAEKYCAETFIHAPFRLFLTYTAFKQWEVVQILAVTDLVLYLFWWVYKEPFAGTTMFTLKLLSHPRMYLIYLVFIPLYGVSEKSDVADVRIYMNNDIFIRILYFSFIFVELTVFVLPPFEWMYPFATFSWIIYVLASFTENPKKRSLLKDAISHIKPLILPTPQTALVPVPIPVRSK